MDFWILNRFVTYEVDINIFVQIFVYTYAFINFLEIATCRNNSHVVNRLCLISYDTDKLFSKVVVLFYSPS